ncbi:hypothetical protein [Taklimakanibacter deserti]|uniref:hypothetical protein n=1 Tax=Taklimakanibacter deserti TaxID=2267839 RepID=UPI000E65E090
MCSQLTATRLSLFDGVDHFVSDFLGITSCRHWSAVLELDRRGVSDFDGPALVTGLFSQISANWHACLAELERFPSVENWRWFDPKVNISPHNASPEVTLERAVTAAAVAQRRRDWSNQIPIASGLIVGPGDRRRAVDLVHQRGSGAFDFVELKVRSNNPLYAAIEILQYGLVWLLSRQNRDILGYGGKTLIMASDVRLSVLAPSTYYRDLNLSWLANGLTEGVQALGEANGVLLSFGFDAFPQWFSWPGAEPATVLSALDARRQR